MVKFIHVLTKLSSPGFELCTDNLETVARILQDYVCDMCLTPSEYNDDPTHIDVGNYEKLLEEKEALYTRIGPNAVYLAPENKCELSRLHALIIDELLYTACGAEFMFDTFTEEELIAQKEEDIKEYRNLVKEGINA